MTQLFECIPNFSEARRPEVIDQIVAAIKSVEGAYMHRLMHAYMTLTVFRLASAAKTWV
jgi:glutamate formiminotransferase